VDVLQDYVRNNNATINVSNKIPLDVLQNNFPDPQKDLFKCDSVAPRSKHPLWGGTNRRTEDNNKYKSTTAVSGKLPTDFTALHANNKIHNGLGSCSGLVFSPFDRFLLIGPSAKGGPALCLLTKLTLFIEAASMWRRRGAQCFFKLRCETKTVLTFFQRSLKIQYILALL